MSNKAKTITYILLFLGVAIPVGVCVYYFNSRLEFINENPERLEGVKAAGIVGASALIIVLLVVSAGYVHHELRKSNKL